jgi:hypothetical protein
MLLVHRDEPQLAECRPLLNERVRADRQQGRTGPKARVGLAALLCRQAPRDEQRPDA